MAEYDLHCFVLLLHNVKQFMVYNASCTLESRKSQSHRQVHTTTAQQRMVQTHSGVLISKRAFSCVSTTCALAGSCCVQEEGKTNATHMSTDITVSPYDSHTARKS